MSFWPPPVIPFSLPKLPSPPRNPIWSKNQNVPYVLSTHIIPAAYLRIDPSTALPDLPPNDPTMSKSARLSAVKIAEERLRNLRLEAEKLPRVDHPRILWICLNRYVRTDLGGRRSRSGLTLFLAHANGFNKETWEPMLESLLANSTGQIIEEVWACESVHTGDSALLNKDNLNSLFHWGNGMRDLLTFLVCYLPSSIISQPLPVHLRRVSEEESLKRIRFGYGSERRLVAIGHSFGGCCSALAARYVPSLFSSLILLDPIVTRPQPSGIRGHRGSISQRFFFPNSLALGALVRRREWNTREDAMSQFLRSPFFKAWDPRVLDLYVTHGLYYDPQEQTFRLKMSPLHEALLFVETPTGGETAWELVPSIDPRIKIFWILPFVASATLGGEEDARDRVALRRSNSSSIYLLNAGHLIPHEAPDTLATHIHAFISRRETIAKM